MKRALGILCVLAASMGCQSNQSWTGDRLTMTTFQSFNDQPREGWRKMASEGEYNGAAGLISRYIDANEPILKSWQVGTLRFHQGQMLACADKYRLALQVLAEARSANLPTTGPVVLGWYVNATIAFIESDRAEFDQARAAIDQAQRSPANEILREKTAVLSRRFNASYLNAWIDAGRVVIPIAGEVDQDKPDSGN